jgi:medium-chain acyl-[acyl-carrier-protein] hydrolase
MTANIWLPYRRPSASARLRLFCFAHAGGSAGFFTSWASLLPPDVELCAVELPGRGARIRDAPFRRMDDLMAALQPALRPLFDMPVAFFGHSMGASVAYESARRLASDCGRSPVRLFVSSRAAPGGAPGRRRIHDLPDRELLGVLRRLQATPSDVLDNAEFMAVLLPAVRADFELLETYAGSASPVLDCPISAFGGDDDPAVDEAGLEAWAGRTRGPFSLRLFPGGHFYLNPMRRAVIDEIRRALGL